MYAIVTGGTRSLGFCVAEELAKDGYTHIILTYNSNTERAEKSKKTLEENYGISVFLVKGDLAQPEAVDAIFDCVEKNFGNKLNALVSNAGAVVGIGRSDGRGWKRQTCVGSVHQTFPSSKCHRPVFVSGHFSSW